MALWAVQSHMMDHSDVAPRLALSSPVPECGKTTVLDMLKNVCANPLATSNLTPATIFRTIAKSQRTLLIDEADTFMDEKSELTGIINSGHTRATATVMRCGPAAQGYSPEEFSTFSAIAIARIGELPRALESRSIVIRMQRAKPDQKLERIKPQHRAHLTSLHDRIRAWAQSAGSSLRSSDPQMPDAFDNRLADNWRMLFAIADQAGGAWPQRARAAALKLSGNLDRSSGEKLLAAIRQAFDEKKVAKVSSQELIGHQALEDALGYTPTQNSLAAALKPFGIAPKVMRIGNSTPRGYERQQFEDAWARYCMPRARPPSDDAP
jgi:putative DNA primase/helicase